ncbi:MAG: ABC transporter substrate-binding protein [Patescibacteria group bacterium]
MNRLFWGGVALIILGVGIYFFVPTEKTGTATLGVIAGTTGQYASAGEGYLKGFELAREEWNKSRALQFNEVVEDDGFDSKKGISAYTKLKSIDNVDAYAILSTFTIDVVNDDVTTEGKPVALGFEQSTAATNDSIFQVLPAARPIQKKLGEELKQNYKKPFAVVSDNTPVYENFYSGFVEGYAGEIHKEMVHDDAALARTLATKIMSSGSDVVVFFTAPKDGALVVRELVRQYAGAPLPQLAFDQSIQSGIQDYKEILGSDLPKLDGAIVALSKNDLTQTFKDAYKTKYSFDAPFAADMGYNSFMLLATTYDADHATWVQNMKSAKFIGADGEVSFDATGLRIPNVAFGLLQNGVVVVK